MTNEHVEELYSKFEKGVAKKERAGLKTSLENCDNEKYENLKKLELKSKSPLKDIVGLIGWIATLFGCLFLIFNLVVYACIVPINADNTEFATKLGNDMTEYAQIAKYELDDAYSSEAVLWLSDKVLELKASENEYETLGNELKIFEDGYTAFTKSIDDAYAEYKKAVSEEQKAAARSVLQTSASNAETAFINSIKNLSVLDGADIDAAYFAYKTELNGYYAVLSNENSTEEAIAKARKDFEESSAKTAFDNLLITVRDYLSKAKIAVNLNAELTDYKAAIEKYAKDVAKYKQDIAAGKDAVKPVKPKLIVGVKEYFGDDKSGAIADLSTAYGAYSNANGNYEPNMTSKPDDSTLLWWTSPLLSEVDRKVVKPTDLTAYQQDFIVHLNIYKAVIKGLPDRLEDISKYYVADGIYQYSYYDEVKGVVRFDYFTCTVKTMQAVLNKTNFEANKTSFGETLDGFTKFNYSADLTSTEYLTEDFNNGLTAAATSAVNAINDFDGAVTGMTNITSQTRTLIRGYKSNTDILSNIVMVFDILLAIVLAGYWITIVLVYKSKAQAENIKFINEQINK